MAVVVTDIIVELCNETEITVLYKYIFKKIILVIIHNLIGIGRDGSCANLIWFFGQSIFVRISSTKVIIIIQDFYSL